MSTMASQITSFTIVYSTVYSDADQRKHQTSASLAFVRGIHQGPVNSPHKWPVTRKMFPFDDVIMVPGEWASTLVWIYRRICESKLYIPHIDGLVQERRNSSALAMELCLSCINSSICSSQVLIISSLPFGARPSPNENWLLIYEIKQNNIQRLFSQNWHVLSPFYFAMFCNVTISFMTW